MLAWRPMKPDWDIFCRVIDNFGDIGVCWRLARQLASEHDVAVRLWVDDPGCLKPLWPALDTELPVQKLGGVEVCHWTTNFTVDRVAEVVIEAFACELPASYIAAMATAQARPRWINLEYLSAESWIDSCHGMASPHPALPLVKHFFFPGFSTTTGGLLRERDLFTARDAAVSFKVAHEPLEISLFCYDTAPVGELLDALANSPQAVRCHVSPGKPLAAVSAHLGGRGPWQLGALSVEPIPFLPQDEYDRLLWRCDINFVRGEDSFLRAQWAAKPFVWQIYEQEDDAHLIKLDAFLERYTASLPPNQQASVKAVFRAWNTGQNLASSWMDFLAHRNEIAGHARDWAASLAKSPDLATALVIFCHPKV